MTYVSISVKIADPKSVDAVMKRYGGNVPASITLPYGTVVVVRGTEKNQTFFKLTGPCLFVEDGDDLEQVNARLTRDLGSLSFREDTENGEPATIEEPATLFNVANHGGLRLCYNKRTRGEFIGEVAGSGFRKDVAKAIDWAGHLPPEQRTAIAPAIASMLDDGGLALVTMFRAASTMPE